jgi:1,4-dihydroxy-2-naphthoate octaprenyltransferase
VYVAAAVAVPVSLVVSVIAGWLPWPALAAVVPSALLVKPFAWALGDPEGPVPLPALGANVVWNLATNAVLAVALVVARWV